MLAARESASRVAAPPKRSVKENWLPCFVLVGLGPKSGIARCLRARGHVVWTFSLHLGPRGDSNRRSVQRRICSLLLSGACVGLVGRIPESSRFRGEAPAELIRPLTAHAHRLEISYLFFKRMTALFSKWYRIAFRLSVPSILLAHQCSASWGLLNCRDLTWNFTQLDTCGYGSPWRVRLLVMSHAVPQVHSLYKSCRLCHGCCTFRLVKHARTNQRDMNGIRGEIRALQLPFLLNKSLALVLSDGAFCHQFARLGRT
eukprot:3407660-Amphidinium_carterae.1